MDKKQLYLEAIKLDPKLASPYSNLATLLAAGESVTVFNSAQPQGTQIDEKQLYLEAIKLDPKLAPPYSNLAINGAQPQGIQMDKKQLYLEAIKLDPKFVLAYGGLANLLAPGESVTLISGAQMTKRTAYR